jgi:quercetin dioxygenase-like cupin family protein
MANPPARYDKPRVFVKGLQSETYSLVQQRDQRLGLLPRVMHTDYRTLGDRSGEKTIVDPGREPFVTQSLQSHFVTVPPGGRDKGHGHQNEAFFYILEGRGFDMHDGLRYDWQQGDAVAVHNDSVHWHNNADPNNRAVALIFKAKPLWLFLGLQQQGPIGTGPAPEDDRWEAPREFAVARAPGDLSLPKVLKPGDTPWLPTAYGRKRLLADATVPLRVKAVDVQLQEIAPATATAREWQMADELFYVLEGRGYDLHWDVEVEITDRYYARVARQPSRWEWSKGDMVYIPTNSVHQHVNTDATNPAVLISASNRIIKQLGYSHTVELEDTVIAARRRDAGELSLVGEA